MTQPAATRITIALIVAGVAPAFGYLSIGNARGSTLGKRTVGLKVVSADTGDAPGVAAALVRTTAQLLLPLTLGAAYAIAALDPLRRTLHDRLAGTVVVEQ